MSTAIPYCDETWNIVSGCMPISSGCKNCWARRTAKRWGKSFEVQTHPELLEKPLHWKRPRTVFVASMGDLFHEDVPFEFIDEVFAFMGSAPQHSFLVLTKRPGRLLDFMRGLRNGCCMDIPRSLPRWATYLLPLPNIWLGVSVEDQPTADARIPILLETPAAHRWVSYEPALGAVDFRRIWASPYYLDVLSGAYGNGAAGPGTPFSFGMCKLGTVNWLVMGGESGPGYRPMDVQWARDVRDQCQAVGVPFYFKQVAAPRPGMCGHIDGVINKQLPKELSHA